MFGLVFSSAKTVENSIVESFQNMHILDKTQNRDINVTYAKLKNLVLNSSLEDLLSIEEILKKTIQQAGNKPKLQKRPIKYR